MGKNEKIEVLRMIAERLDRAEVTWSLGASMLLYFEGIVSDFHDIDIMVTIDDAAKAELVMTALGAKPLPPNPDEKYKTKLFLEYCLRDVEIDIMAGFMIQRGGVVYDCSLKPDQIVEYFDLSGVKIPFQSVELWLKYYELMGRDDKVEMINSAIGLPTRGPSRSR